MICFLRDLVTEGLLPKASLRERPRRNAGQALYNAPKGCCLPLFIIICLFFDLPAQTYYQGPAFGSIPGGVAISTDDFPDTLGATSGLRCKGFPTALETRTLPPLIDDRYDDSQPLAPLNSNEFSDPAVLQSVHAPAVIVDFEGPRDPGWYFPPDPHMAVGPDHVIVVDNSRFTIYDKRGQRLKEISAAAWFTNLIPNSGPFDCQIIYDQFENRWVQEWLTYSTANSTSHWLISVSDDADPIGSWVNFAFPNHLNGITNGSTWGDYPKIGYDVQAFYITGRQLSYENFFRNCKLRIIPKSQLYASTGTPVNYTDLWDFRLPGDSTRIIDGPPIPAAHFDSSNTAYLIADSPFQTSNYIIMWSIEDPLSLNPIVSGIRIPVTARKVPPNAQQLGGPVPIFSDGRRYRNAVVREGNLWTANSVAGGSFNYYSYAHYLRIDLITHAVLEDVALGSNYCFYIYPAVMLDQDLNLTMTFTRSSPYEYASAAFTGRRSGDPAGLSPTTILKAGEAYYQGIDGLNRNRWGDYSGIALDPFYRNTIWGFMEYAEYPSDTWGTWIGAFTQQYTIRGVVKNAGSLQPVGYVRIEIPETNHHLVTDSTGSFYLGSPQPQIHLHASAFAYQDTSIELILNSYAADSVEVFLQPEIESVIAGYVRDELGNGIAAQLYFYPEGNPWPGPYAITSSDSNGYYQLQTVIAVYDIEVNPQAPFLSKRLEDITLTPAPLTLNIELVKADLLLVDDDEGDFYESYYQQALESVNKTFYHWDVQQEGLPTAAIRKVFADSLLIWFSGNSSPSPLDSTEQQELLQHLASGGKLFLSGQDIAEYSFISGLGDTLGIGFSQNSTIDAVRGLASHPLSNGLFLLIQGDGGASNQISPDILTLNNPATTEMIFHYGSGSNRPAGAVYVNEENHSKALFLGFGFEAITDPNSRNLLMERALEYLLDITIGIEPGEERELLPGEFVLYQNYPNPFNASTNIEIRNPKKEYVTLKVFNVLGEEVAVLVSSQLVAGSHRFEFDASNLPSGVYYYQLKAGKYCTVKKMVLLK
jgi:hypothetical protein